MTEQKKTKKPYQQKKRETTTYGTMDIGRIASRVVRPLVGKEGFCAVDVLVRWPQIVGQEFAAHVQPLKIAYPKGRRDAGVLHVRVSSSAFATELQHDSARLIERVNRYFGYRAVVSLHVLQGGFVAPATEAPTLMPEAAPEETLPPEMQGFLDAVEDPELRERLLGIAAAMTSKKE